MGDTIGDGAAAQADDVAMGDASILLVVVVALKAANEPMAAKEKKAAASHMALPLLLVFSSVAGATFCRAKTELGRLVKEAEAMEMFWVGCHKDPPLREVE